jgi:hypothetical protein
MTYLQPFTNTTQHLLHPAAGFHHLHYNIAPSFFVCRHCLLSAQRRDKTPTRHSTQLSKRISTKLLHRVWDIARMEPMEKEAQLVGTDGHKMEHRVRVVSRLRWTRIRAIPAATATNLMLVGTSALWRTATPQSAARVRPTATAFVSITLSRVNHMA